MRPRVGSHTRSGGSDEGESGCGGLLEAELKNPSSVIGAELKVAREVGWSHTRYFGHDPVPLIVLRLDPGRDGDRACDIQRGIVWNQDVLVVDVTGFDIKYVTTQLVTVAANFCIE